MLKLFRRALLIVAAVCTVTITAGAQQMPDIPVDQDVRIGQLPNGLTYYIRHNEKPKGQADFYIAQKVGSILEEDNQRGLAHFLEHMCFNGTKNFPGNNLIDWLESVGVKFGQNLNAYTSVDETVYNIANVPTARTSVQDSCLLILHDWANDLLLDPAEIDKERGVIHQEWRRSMVGQMRILEKILPEIYPGSRYGERLPIGTMEVVDNFEPQALRDYYETWYRPDQQGIIVVGDIDVDYIEGKIKEIFSDIEMPANAKERAYYPVPDTPGTIYAIGSDPEQPYGIIQLSIKTDAVPNEIKGNSMYLMIKYMTSMIEAMLDQRLNDIANDPNAPFAQAGADYDNFLLAKTKDAFTVSAVSKGDNLTEPFEAVYRELLRAKRGGFTVGEYQRARDEYMSKLEKAYNSRETRQSGAYVQEYIRHFIDNEPIPSIEDEYEFYKMVTPMIDVNTINQLLPELVIDDNRVVVVIAPQNDTFKVPTADELAAVVAKVDAEDIEAYVDEMKSEPLIPSLPTPGKIVSIADDAQWGAKVITLSNGVKVVVKPTDFKKDEILMEAIAIGGTSNVGDDKANEMIVMPYAMSQSGLGSYTNTDLQKYMAGKQASVSLEFDDYKRGISGHTTVKDLPTMMELLYMTFIDYEIAENDFAAMQSMLTGMLANQEVQPQFQFQKMLSDNLVASPTKHTISVDIVNAANRQAILDIIHSNLTNAADFTFYFVGDIDIETLKPLLEQYIATLPADASKAVKSYTVNPALELITGENNIAKTFKMETPQTWCAILVDGIIPYTPKDAQLPSIASQILSNRLLKTIREDMGAVYSIGAQSMISRQGDVNTIIIIPFPMKPEMKDEVLSKINEMLKDMASNISDDELNPIKEFMVKQATENKELNNPWINAMVGTAVNDVDTFNGNIDIINSITVDDVKNFMANLLKQGNYTVLTLDPEE